jgi:hypothetical protein
MPAAFTWRLETYHQRSPDDEDDQDYRDARDQFGGPATKEKGRAILDNRSQNCIGRKRNVSPDADAYKAIKNVLIFR